MKGAKPQSISKLRARERERDLMHAPAGSPNIHAERERESSVQNTTGAPPVDLFAIRAVAKQNLRRDVRFVSIHRTRRGKQARNMGKVIHEYDKLAGIMSRIIIRAYIYMRWKRTDTVERADVGVGEEAALADPRLEGAVSRARAARPSAAVMAHAPRCTLSRQRVFIGML
jgi:hypothetical protein